MTALTITAANVRAVTIIDQSTAPANVALTRGQVVRIGTGGKWVLANATDAANLGSRRGIVLKDVGADETVTVLHKGTIDLNPSLDALAIGASVFVSDTSGALDDAAGTVSSVAGTVVAGWAETSVAKLLRIDL